jgi:uncharacterized RDD family membrane protein YckC
MQHEKITVQTPEYVEIEYELAGIGSRALACLVDTVVQAVLTGAVVALALYLLSVTSLYGPGNPLGILPMILLGTAGTVTFIAYWIIVEMVTDGRSIGKRMAGLRVIRDDGTPISFWDSAIRNLVRLIDFLPASYFIGMISVWVSGRCKRLGDYAAGTVVVKEREAQLPSAAHPAVSAARHDQDATGGSANSALMAKVRLLSDEHAAAARRFIQRRDELDPHARAQLANRLAQSISADLDVGLGAWADAEAFISEIVSCLSRARGGEDGAGASPRR